MLIRHVPASDEDDSENKEEAKIDLGTPPIVAQDTEALHETMVSQHGLSMFQLLGLAVLTCGAGIGVMRYRARAGAHHHDERMLA